ncbi:hypothetical protein KB276_000971 [Escherichia coli]|nr:hypothetical protein [Escherichia coli]EHJ8055728.1 hypothetical protein [Escherichia coli]MBC0354057.1 hypothetical protein [Escherichia coli]HDX6570931.1 hypothetical protein [Escherichia coli]
MSETSQSILVNMPMSLYTASRSFKAISNGKIYVGIPDTDPVYPENQVPVYIVNESGNKIQIPQPIVINSGGHPVYNGQIINKIITDEQYSLAVYDSYGSQEYYFDNVVRYDPEALMQLLAGKEGYSYIGELQSAADFFGLVKNDGARVKLRSWYAGWSVTTYGKPKGGGEFIFQANVPKAKHDGCIYFSPTVPYSTNLSSYVTGQGETDPTGSGVWVRDIGDATHIHTDWAGIGDGSTSTSSSAHSDALQNVFNACMSLSKHVFIDEGWVHVEKQVTLGNYEGQLSGIPQIHGMGMGRSYLTTYPLGTDLYSIVIESENTAQDWKFEQVQIREKSMTKLGYMLSAKNITGFIWRQVKFAGGLQQVFTDFLLSGQFDECSWFSGYNGLRMTNSPNAIILTRCQFLSMSNQGAWFDDGAQIYFQGGSIEGCGNIGETVFRGIFYTKGGAFGTVGLIIDGVYFEGNTGTNIYIRHSSNRSVNHKIINCNFNNGIDNYANNHVLVDGQNYSYINGVKLTIEMRGNTCTGFNGYTPSTSRPDVNIVNYAVNQCIFIDYDNFWTSNQEPVISPNVFWKTSPDSSFYGRITGNTGAVNNRKNILSSSRSSVGTYLLTFNHIVDADGVICTLIGATGGVMVQVEPSGTGATIRTYNSSGALTDADFFIRGYKTRPDFTYST